MSIGIKSPGKYVQGKGALNDLGKNVKKLGSKFLIVCSENNVKRIGGIMEESLKSAEKECVFYRFNGECSKAEIESIMNAQKENSCDVIIGAGGGKAIDAAKAAAENLGGLTLIVIPTIASNDAPTSGVAVIYNDEGVVIKALITRRNPDLVLVDTDIIAKSPKRLLSAGIGDALATWFEARACKKSGAKNMARGTCSATAYMMARLCYDMLKENTEQALIDIDKNEATEALENIVEANIYLSGIGWESGGLAVAHAVNDGLAHIKETHNMYHGEKVAFGTLTQLVIEGEDEQELKEVMHLMHTANLPMTFSELGIEDTSEENLRKAAEAACVPTQSSKNLRADITADEVLKAMIRADELGRAYKA